MLINRKFRENSFIFVDRIDLPYLNMLINLGSFPIFMENNSMNYSRYVTVTTHASGMLFLNKFNDKWEFKPCTISDIKYLLRLFKYSFDACDFSRINFTMYVWRFLKIYSITKC